MKIAGVGRSNKPNCSVLTLLQEYSNRGWVYREEQGWIFAELTPEELAEFKSYKCDVITIPRMKIRLPYDYATVAFDPDPDEFANWFVHCTMPQAYPMLLSKFHIHQITNYRVSRFWHPVEPGSYETWLWADEVEMYRDLGYEITVHTGYAWEDWGVPPEWKAPFTRPIRVRAKEHLFIYALVDELTQKVYVGQTDNLERRLVEHLRDTTNLDKVALIQSLRAQGREPELFELEEVAPEKTYERERFWSNLYRVQGYKVINKDYGYIPIKW